MRFARPASRNRRTQIADPSSRVPIQGPELSRADRTAKTQKAILPVLRVLFAVGFAKESGGLVADGGVSAEYQIRVSPRLYQSASIRDRAVAERRHRDAGPKALAKLRSRRASPVGYFVQITSNPHVPELVMLSSGGVCAALA